MKRATRKQSTMRRVQAFVVTMQYLASWPETYQIFIFFLYQLSNNDKQPQQQQQKTCFIEIIITYFLNLKLN